MLPQKHSEQLLKIVSLYGKPTIRFWAEDLLRKMEIERKTNPSANSIEHELADCKK